MRCAGRARPTTTSGRGPGRDPAAARALDGELDDAVCPALGHVHRGCLPAGGHRDAQRADRGGRLSMRIRWKLRMAASQREVWTGAQLRRLLAEKAGTEMSAASVSALFTKEPSQVKLSTLAALCTALECTPNDLFDVDTTPVEQPVVPAKPQAAPVKAVSARGRSLPPV